MMPSIRIVHVNRDPFEIYVGRRMRGRAGSPYANPYRIGPDGSRDDVLQRYARYILEFRTDLLDGVGELRDHVLGCWCAPKGGLTADDPLVCHGQILAKLAERGVTRDLYLLAAGRDLAG